MRYDRNHGSVGSSVGDRDLASSCITFKLQRGTHNTPHLPTSAVPYLVSQVNSSFSLYSR
jgi:hypothetical protein